MCKSRRSPRASLPRAYVDTPGVGTARGNVIAPDHARSLHSIGILLNLDFAFLPPRWTMLLAQTLIRVEAVNMTAGVQSSKRNLIAPRFAFAFLLCRQMIAAPCS